MECYVSYKNYLYFLPVQLESSEEEDQQRIKRQKTMKDVLSEGKNNSSYHATFGHIVAICHARIPFIQLRAEVHVHNLLGFQL